MKKYNDIFLEQKQLGIIEEAEEIAKPGQCHYSPHHPVIREDKSTKVRIVSMLQRNVCTKVLIDPTHI